MKNFIKYNYLIEQFILDQCRTLTTEVQNSTIFVLNVFPNIIYFLTYLIY